MTKGGRIFGGIFSIIGAGIVLIMTWVIWLINLITALFGVVATWITFILLLASGVLGLVGGILLCTDKTAGGVLAIIAGALDCVLTIVLVILSTSMPWPLILMFFIPPAILLTGGIVGTAVGSEFD